MVGRWSLLYEFCIGSIRTWDRRGLCRNDGSGKIRVSITVESP